MDAEPSNSSSAQGLAQCSATHDASEREQQPCRFARTWNTTSKKIGVENLRYRPPLRLASQRADRISRSSRKRQVEQAGHDCNGRIAATAAFRTRCSRKRVRTVTTD